MSLTLHLALLFHVFIAVAVMVMVCGRCGFWPSWHRPFSQTHRLTHSSTSGPQNPCAVPALRPNPGYANEWISISHY